MTKPAIDKPVRRNAISTPYTALWSMLGTLGLAYLGVAIFQPDWLSSLTPASARMEHNAETHQVVLWTMGQAHVDEVLGRLADRHGVAVEAERLRIALRETFIRAATVQGRHVKQSGGHGQYAVCQLQIEPLGRGAGIEFVDAADLGIAGHRDAEGLEPAAHDELVLRVHQGLWRRSHVDSLGGQLLQ